MAAGLAVTCPGSALKLLHDAAKRLTALNDTALERLGVGLTPVSAPPKRQEAGHGDFHDRQIASDDRDRARGQ